MSKSVRFVAVFESMDMTCAASTVNDVHTINRVCGICRLQVDDDSRISLKQCVKCRSYVQKLVAMDVSLNIDYVSHMTTELYLKCYTLNNNAFINAVKDTSFTNNEHIYRPIMF